MLDNAVVKIIVKILTIYLNSDSSIPIVYQPWKHTNIILIKKYIV